MVAQNTLRTCEGKQVMVEKKNISKLTTALDAWNRSNYLITLHEYNVSELPSITCTMVKIATIYFANFSSFPDLINFTTAQRETVIILCTKKHTFLKNIEIFPPKNGQLKWFCDVLGVPYIVYTFHGPTIIKSGSMHRKQRTHRLDKWWCLDRAMGSENRVINYNYYSIGLSILLTRTLS